MAVTGTPRASLPRRAALIPLSCSSWTASVDTQYLIYCRERDARAGGARKTDRLLIRRERSTQSPRLSEACVGYGPLAWREHSYLPWSVSVHHVH
jgi:hypothetical protein